MTILTFFQCDKCEAKFPTRKLAVDHKCAKLAEYQTGLGGCYALNDGNPENDVEDDSGLEDGPDADDIGEPDLDDDAEERARL